MCLIFNSNDAVVVRPVYFGLLMCASCRDPLGMILWVMSFVMMLITKKICACLVGFSTLKGSCEEAAGLMSEAWRKPAPGLTLRNRIGGGPGSPCEGVRATAMRFERIKFQK